MSIIECWITKEMIFSMTDLVASVQCSGFVSFGLLISKTKWWQVVSDHENIVIHQSPIGWSYRRAMSLSEALFIKKWMTNIDQWTPNYEVKNGDMLSYRKRQPPFLHRWSAFVNQHSFPNLMTLYRRETNENGTWINIFPLTKRHCAVG